MILQTPNLLKCSFCYFISVVSPFVQQQQRYFHLVLIFKRQRILVNFIFGLFVVLFSSISILVLTVKTITYGKFSQMSPKVRDIKKVENILNCGSILLGSPHPNQRRILTEP